MNTISTVVKGGTNFSIFHFITYISEIPETNKSKLSMEHITKKYK